MSYETNAQRARSANHFYSSRTCPQTKARGIKLNYPEAVALICDEVMEEARAGRNYDEVVAHGSQVLTEADVLEGVAELASRISVEPLFDDGTKLVIVAHSMDKYCIAHKTYTIPQKLDRLIR
jgi:urease subunit gamma